MPRVARLLAGIPLLAAAAALVFVAVDLDRWHEALRADDVRFEQAPALAKWEADETLPASPARGILGVDDDVAFRAAVRDMGLLIAAMRTGSDRNTGALLVDATRRLSDVSQTDPNPKRRSQAANLLAVLALESGGTGSSSSGQSAFAQLQNAIRSFQAAVIIDPDNGDAKRNLEVILRVRLREYPIGETPENADPGRGQRAGAGERGGGY